MGSFTEIMREAEQVWGNTNEFGFWPCYILDDCGTSNWSFKQLFGNTGLEFKRNVWAIDKDLVLLKYR